MLVRFLNSNHPCFLGDKSNALWLDKNNMAALNNERVAEIWNLGNVKLQRATENCSLRLPMKNLMLKVSNLIFKRAFFFHCKAVHSLKQLLENLEICVSSLHVRWWAVSSVNCSLMYSRPQNSTSQKKKISKRQPSYLGKDCDEAFIFVSTKKILRAKKLHMLSLLRSDDIAVASPSKSNELF